MVKIMKKVIFFYKKNVVIVVVVVGENIPSGIPPTQNVYFGCKDCNFSLQNKPITSIDGNMISTSQ